MCVCVVYIDGCGQQASDTDTDRIAEDNTDASHSLQGFIFGGGGVEGGPLGGGVKGDVGTREKWGQRKIGAGGK